MTNTTIRLRDDQREFIVQITKEKATDLSEFVRLCVDKSAKAVAGKIPKRKTLTPLKSLRKARAK